MKSKIPFRIFLGLFLLFSALQVSAQQSASGQADTANSSQSSSQSADAGSPALSPKALQVERAKVMMAEKRFDSAIQEYQDLLREEPKNAVYMNMIGIAYLDLANFDLAKKYFARAAKADKTFASAVNNLGMVYYHQKNFRGAIRQYQRAVLIDPNQAGAHSNLGFAYYNSNKFAEAAVEFQKALELDPRIFERNDKAGAVVQDRSVSNHGLFFFTMAKIYAQRNDAEHCAEYLRKSLDEGYKDVAKAATDPAFKDVINDQVVQDVLARVLPAKTDDSATHPGA